MSHERVIAPDTEVRWFAVQVKPRCEKVVAAISTNKGYEPFFPLQTVRRRWSDRVKVLELPLFPGYVFCRLGTESRLPLLTIPAVIGLVGAGKVPLPIDDSEIAGIRIAVKSGLFMEPCIYLDRGDRVQVEEGPLAGLEGFYLESRKQDRIVVSVTLLQRSVAIEIERDWVRPLKSKPFPRPQQLAAAEN